MDHKTGFIAGDGDDEMSRKNDLSVNNISALININVFNYSTVPYT
jgi:hypothetical protein